MHRIPLHTTAIVAVVHRFAAIFGQFAGMNDGMRRKQHAERGSQQSERQEGELRDGHHGDSNLGRLGRGLAWDASGRQSVS